MFECQCFIGKPSPKRGIQTISALDLMVDGKRLEVIKGSIKITLYNYLSGKKLIDRIKRNRINLKKTGNILHRGSYCGIILSSGAGFRTLNTIAS